MKDPKINQRKREHLDIIAKDRTIDRQQSGFDRIRLMHRALPELNFADIDTRCHFLGKTLSFPLLISSMTGGDDNVIRSINRNLATAAEHCQVAMAVGSERVLFNEKAAQSSFALREYAPTTALLGNLGAIQLNHGFGLNECKKAVDILDADGLYLHLNPLQEVIQPEGDTDFAGLLDKIKTIQRELTVPVLLKEVGCGLSPQDVSAAMAAGIRIFDIAGRGGTSWSRIEHYRSHESDDLGLLFQDWGITTAEALRLNIAQNPSATYIASGGIRNGIDMAKSIILGARLCGLAAPFLAAARESSDAVITVIERLRREFQTAMFLLGCANHEQLHGNTDLIIHSAQNER